LEPSLSEPGNVHPDLSSDREPPTYRGGGSQGRVSGRIPADIAYICYCLYNIGHRSQQTGYMDLYPCFLHYIGHRSQQTDYIDISIYIVSQIELHFYTKTSWNRHRREIDSLDRSDLFSYYMGGCPARVWWGPAQILRPGSRIRA